MFEDQSAPGSLGSRPAAGVPPTRPVSTEPEDILASVEVTPAGVAPRVSVPVRPVALRPIPRSQGAGVELPLEPVASRHVGRTIALVSLGIVGLGAVVGAGWYGWTVWQASSSTVTPVQPTGQTQTPGVTPTPTQTPTTPVVTQPTTIPRDTDRDGLSDEDEAQYGTNPTLVDSDADGLTDRDEVSVFKTNPLLRDTDGDTFSDGDEVRNGYDPKGSGKLLNLPQ